MRDEDETLTGVYEGDRNSDPGTDFFFNNAIYFTPD